jgi:caffeoyl-CoA O-methyltransferase
MTKQSLQLTDDLYQYLLQVSLRESSVQRRLREETAQLPQAQMQVAPEQGQFMGLLARLINARKAIEIGVFTGYSSLCFALAMPDDGRLIACDISKNWTNIARRYWQEAGVDHKIELRLAPALATLDALLAEGEQGRFDLAFIDADKESYRHYYERALQLIRPGGLILLDNMLWGGHVADPSIQDADTNALRELNAFLKTDDRIWLSLIPIADGLTMAIKKEPT